MRLLLPKYRAEIERILGRRLEDDELEPCLRLQELPGGAILVAQAVAAVSKPLAVMYLQERVSGITVGTVLRFIEAIVEPGLDAATWRG
jgi:hypothetical protein